MPQTCASTLALQLEMIKRVIPAMFPIKKVSAYARYRYSWERGWRTLSLHEYTISDSMCERFLDVRDVDLVRKQVKAKLSRYHWKDKAGRMRRVVEFDVFLQP